MSLRTQWPVGTVLRGTERYPGGSNTKTIRLTYVSDQTILAVDLEDGHEGLWTLSLREWHEVKP